MDINEHYHKPIITLTPYGGFSTRLYLTVHQVSLIIHPQLRAILPLENSLQLLLTPNGKTIAVLETASDTSEINCVSSKTSFDS